MSDDSFENIRKEAERIHANSGSVDVLDAQPRIGKETSPRSISVPIPYVWLGVKSKEELEKEIIEKLDIHITLHPIMD